MALFTEKEISEREGKWLLQVHLVQDGDEVQVSYLPNFHLIIKYQITIVTTHIVLTMCQKLSWILYPDSCITQNNVSLCPFYRWGNQGTEQLNNLFKDWRFVSGKVRQYNSRAQRLNSRKRKRSEPKINNQRKPHNTN